ncbi:hypothetical protein ACVWYH_000709 [Bradyrhizobium sp. GM24.11]
MARPVHVGRARLLMGRLWACGFSGKRTFVFAFGFEYACWLVFRTVPRRILTIGELAREAAGCSFAKLTTENKECAPSDRWFALTAILRGLTGHKIAITPETTFFAEHAMPTT